MPLAGNQVLGLAPAAVHGVLLQEEIQVLLVDTTDQALAEGMADEPGDIGMDVVVVAFPRRTR